MTLLALEPLHIRRPAGDIHVQPGGYIELSDDEGARLLQKAPSSVRVVNSGLGQRIRPGDVVEWLSPALPKQQGEVLAVDGDCFTVWHPLTEKLCRLPVSWITRMTRTASMEDRRHERSSSDKTVSLPKVPSDLLAR